jgi:hypothetical protein
VFLHQPHPTTTRSTPTPTTHGDKQPPHHTQATQGTGVLARSRDQDRQLAMFHQGSLAAPEHSAQRKRRRTPPHHSADHANAP